MIAKMSKSMFLAGVMMLVGGVSAAWAQSVMVADIPFDFRISGTVHQAGRYEFRPIEDDHAVEFDAFGHGATLTQVVTRIEPATREWPSDGRLTFYKIGDLYYLGQMWIPGEDGFLFNTPKARLVPDRASRVSVPLATLASLK